MQLVWQDRTLTPDGPPINTSITPAETAELQRLAKGKRCLEVGAAYGYSAVTMALGGARWVTSVDPHQWLPSYQPFLANVAAYGVGDHIDAVVLSSFEVMPDLTAQGHTFDLVFVDGDHAEATVAHDAEWGRKLLAPGGVLACHDWDEVTCPGVRAALERLLGPPHRLVDTLAIYEGLA